MRILRPDFTARLTRFVSSSFWVWVEGDFHLLLCSNNKMPEKIAEMIATVCGKGRRTTRGYFKCCCPAHDDQRPSLLIFVRADGRLSFRCLAGCPTRRIKIALRQRGFDLSRVKKQTVSEMQDGLLPARFLPEHPPNAQGNLLVR